MTVDIQKKKPLRDDESAFWDKHLESTLQNGKNKQVFKRKHNNSWKQLQIRWASQNSLASWKPDDTAVDH